MPTNCVVCVSSAPATPAIAAETTYAVTSRRCSGTPIALARTGLSRIVRSDNPTGELIHARAATNSRSTIANV